MNDLRPLTSDLRPLTSDLRPLAQSRPGMERRAAGQENGKTEGRQQKPAGFRTTLAQLARRTESLLLNVTCLLISTYEYIAGFAPRPQNAIAVQKSAGSRGVEAIRKCPLSGKKTVLILKKAS